MFYFFTIITIIRRSFGLPTRDDLLECWLHWEKRIDPEAPFFGGEHHDTVDLKLFGIVQMCASIPGEPLEVLRTAPGLDGLRRWVGSMQQRFTDYRHLHTARCFEPHGAEPRLSGSLDRAVYWLGAATMWLALPVTLPMTLFYTRRIRKRNDLR